MTQPLMLDPRPAAAGCIWKLLAGTAACSLNSAESSLGYCRAFNEDAIVCEQLQGRTVIVHALSITGDAQTTSTRLHRSFLSCLSTAASATTKWRHDTGPYCIIWRKIYTVVPTSDARRLISAMHCLSRLQSSSSVAHKTVSGKSIITVTYASTIHSMTRRRRDKQ